MKLKYYLLLLIVVPTFSAYSQNIWTLEDCINYAHSNNLQIKRQELQADIAENNKNQSYLNVLPSVNAGVSRFYNFGRYIAKGNNQIENQSSFDDSYNLNIDLNIFSGLQNYNTIKQNQYLVLAGIQNVEKEKVQITLDIATAYLTILFKEELMQVSANQLSVTKLQVDRTQKLVDVGSAARGDLLEIQAQRASENLYLVNAQNDVKLAYLNLTQLLDLDSTQGFKIDFPDTVEPDLVSPIASAIDIYNDALNIMPQIKSAEYQLQGYQHNLAVQRGKRIPQIYASSSYGKGFSSILEDDTGQDYTDQFKNNQNTMVGFGINIPIFNKWQVNNSISNAKIYVSDAEYSLDLIKQQLYKEIQQAQNDAISSRESYLSSLEAVSWNRESFKYTEQKFNVGIVNSVEYSIAKNRLIKAESDLLQAKYQYIFSMKIIDFYRGIQISL